MFAKLKALLRRAEERPPSIAGRIFDSMCSRKRSEPSDTRGTTGPKRPAWPCVSCSFRTSLSTFFHSTPKGGFIGIGVQVDGAILARFGGDADSVFQTLLGLFAMTR